MTAGSENQPVSAVQTATNVAPPSTPSQLGTALKREHPEWITDVIAALGEVTAVGPRQHLVEVCSFLKGGTDAKFDFLANLCRLDRGVEGEPQVEVDYRLFCTTKY